MNDHEAYLQRLDAESAKVRRMSAAAAAQRTNEEKTYYLNQKPYTHCEDGKCYDIYLLHRGSMRCPSRMDMVNIGFFHTPLEALNRARNISENVMFCPECLSDHVGEKFKNAYSQSFYAKDKKFFRCVLGKAAIVGRDPERVSRMMHHAGCSHYQQQGGVDFGHQTSDNAFFAAILDTYPELVLNDIQPCVACFPDMWSGLSEKLKEMRKKPAFRHMLQEMKPDGQIFLHHYGCSACSDRAEDLGWSSWTYDLVTHLHFDFHSNQLFAGLGRCHKCMGDDEYREIREELIQKIEVEISKNQKKVAELQVQQRQQAAQQVSESNSIDIMRRLIKKSNNPGFWK